MTFARQESCRADFRSVALLPLREYKNFVSLGIAFIACTRRRCGTNTACNQRRRPCRGKERVRRIYAKPRQPAHGGALLAAPAHAGDGTTARGVADLPPWRSEPAAEAPGIGHD